MTFQLRLRNDELITLPQPAIMGIINVSPDSFYNPCHSIDEVLKTAEAMIANGANILDIGGEATNPNVLIQKNRPSENDELHRVLPAVDAVRAHFNVLISVDTSRAIVMREAVHLGASMINDQRALQDENALETVMQLKTPVCLMHFFKTMRQPGFLSKQQLLLQIKQELTASIDKALSVGITQDRIIIDPGFGQGNYGKNMQENFYLLNHLQTFIQLGYPVMIGWSRKSMIGEALGGRNHEERLFGSLAADTIATYLGAHIVRVHDVRAAKDATQIVRCARELMNI